MPEYMFVYHGGKMPESEEAKAASMAAWGQWMEANGSTFVDPGNPVGKSRTVSIDGVADDGGANPTSGYTIVKASDIDAACDLARSNPILADGGSIEVAQIHRM